MIPMPIGIRLSALAAPILILMYGVLRLIDGSDGDHGPGWAWNIGHALFLVAFVLIGVMIGGLRRLVSAGAARTRVVANVAAVAGLVGVACFCWVIVGDLFDAVDEAAPLPEVLELIGPLAFQLGWLTLLVLLVASRRLPVWSPVLVLAGFVLFAANLDLLPLGALFLLAGLAPLAMPVSPPADRRRQAIAQL